MLESNLWLVVVAGGPVLLAILLAFVLLMRRRRGPAERQASKQATERLYDEDSRR
ncbi:MULTISPECIES: hypothetical protein [unclassified Mesorhizobium]|uniref:hypothetical protein n=1 Tax=unclassified Mesorhizobium TaxID=325217 RepID=UPI0015E361E9|nr:MULTISPECIES: hypothetical protein [unclassified Mesorhizobium]